MRRLARMVHSQALMQLLGRLFSLLGLGGSCWASIATGCGGSTDVHTQADYRACSGPGQCLALVPGCCGGCGAPALADVTGVNTDKQDEFRTATCGDPNPVCPAFPTMPEPNLVAFCEA